MFLQFYNVFKLLKYLSGEASKQIHEYKLKLQKAEQDIATLEGTVSFTIPTVLWKGNNIPGLTPAHREYAIALIQEGMSTRTIAQRF